jgi:hypothetical protein
LTQKLHKPGGAGKPADRYRAPAPISIAKRDARNGIMKYQYDYTRQKIQAADNKFLNALAAVGIGCFTDQ